jgi:tetratricopeptide (TPR) repeat protein
MSTTTSTYNAWRHLYVFAIAIIMLSACNAGTLNEKFEEALKTGNLTEAELHLKKMNDDKDSRHYGGLLIEEYISIDNLDRAIYVFEHITGHCSMSDTQFTALYKNAEYTKKYAKIIYDALLKNGRYDEAWEYHTRSFKDSDYPGNAPDYLSYMSDVIIEMRQKGKNTEAQQFIKQKSIWFLKNVNNHKYGDTYPNSYRYENMCEELNNVYNTTQ